MFSLKFTNGDLGLTKYDLYSYPGVSFLRERQFNVYDDDDDDVLAVFSYSDYITALA